MARPRAPKEKLELNGLAKHKPGRYKDRMDSSLIAFPPGTTGIEPTIPLSKKTRKAWDLTIPNLLILGVLAPADMILLEKGFESLEECNKAVAAIKEFDKEMKAQGVKPWESIKARQKLQTWYRQSLADCTMIFSRFGLTPSDRSRLDMIPDSKPNKDADPLDILMGK